MNPELRKFIRGTSCAIPKTDVQQPKRRQGYYKVAGRSALPGIVAVGADFLERIDRRSPRRADAPACRARVAAVHAEQFCLVGVKSPDLQSMESLNEEAGADDQEGDGGS